MKSRQIETGRPEKMGSPVTKHQHMAMTPPEHQARRWLREAVNQVNQYRRDKEPPLTWTRGYNDAWTIREEKK